MSEVTIRINKTTLFVIGALIVGVVVGYVWGNLGDNVNAGKKNNSVVESQPTDNTASTPAPNIVVDKDDHIRGTKNPKVILVEYSDFQCPYCKRFHPNLVQALKDFPNEVAWVYRHFPLSFHQNAQISAEASECAAEQGKFWELADMMFEKGQSDGTGLEGDNLKSYAKTLGLNMSKFNNCLDTGKYKTEVSKDYSSGTAAGIQGTPGTVVVSANGQKLVSGAVPYETLKSAIEAAL